MLFDSLTSTQRWTVALIVSVCFVIVVSPIVLKLINKVGDTIGIRLVNSQGCASWIGILVQVLIFFLFIRLIIHILSKMAKKDKETYDESDTQENTQDNIKANEMCRVMNKEYPPFNGLVSPGDMLRCNGAQLIAENHQSPECVDAARQCLSNPFSKECQDKLNHCVDVSDQALGKVVMDNCGFAYRP
jgi:hypothetical protein